MKYRHHPALHVLVPGEVARRAFRKDLWHGLLKLVGNPAVFVGIKIILVVLISLLGFHCPLMEVGGMVEHNVQHEVHAFAMHGFAQRDQLLQGSEAWIHLSEVGNRIAPITFPLRTFKYGHQVQKIDPQVLQVWQFGRHVFQRTGKAVHVEAHPCELVAQKPGTFFRFGLIPSKQYLFPLLVTPDEAL